MHNYTTNFQQQIPASNIARSLSRESALFTQPLINYPETFHSTPLTRAIGLCMRGSGMGLLFMGDEGLYWES